MDRRSFLLKSSLLGATVATGLPAVSLAALGAEEPKKEAQLRLASQDGRIPGKDMKEKLAKLEKWGAVGIEFGGGGLPGRVKSIKDGLAGTNIKVAAICAGYAHNLLNDDPEKRQQCMQSIKDILTACGELGSPGLIVVPAFNGQTKMNNNDARKLLVDDLLPQLGEHAAKNKTHVLLEPLNRGEAFFLRQLADAAAICRDVEAKTKNDGVAMMGDFFHMGIEETSDMGAFLSAGKYLHHVHLASRQRNLPGQDERSYVGGFRGLKMIGYQDFMSLECGCKGDPEVEIPKSFRFLEDQWKQATL